MFFNKSISKWLYSFFIFISFSTFIGIWFILSITMQSAETFLPSPYKVLLSTVDLFYNHEFHKDILASIWRVTAGFTLALLIGVPAGILIGTTRHVEALIQPLNDFFRYLPVAALIPLTILWCGIDDEQKILIIFIGTVFQLIPLVADSVARTPKNMIELGYTMGYRKWQVVIRVVTPWCAPQIYDHARVSLGLAWSYLIVAELVAAKQGIGHVIIQAQRMIQVDYVMSGILIIGIIGVFFDYMFRLPKSRLFPWLK